MKNRNMSLLFAVLTGCIGTACQKKIKTTSFIVSPTLSVLPGSSEGGKFRWVTLNGPPFIVHFSSYIPCVGDVNDLKGSKDSPASCVLKKKSDGLIKFEIRPQVPMPHSLAAPALPTYATYAMVDYCRGCLVVPVNPPPPPPQHPLVGTALSNPPLVPIDCNEAGIAVADPQDLTVYAGQQITWQQVGPDATIKWQTVVPAPVCANGTSTFGSGAQTICTITSDAVAGTTYPYKLKYTNTETSKSCDGTANLVIGTSSPKPVAQ